MQKHIFQPIPDLDNLPEPADKEERLRVIIANLDKQHLAVRASILAEAQQQLRRLTEQHNNNTTQQQAPSSPSPATANTATAQQAAHARLLANLNAPCAQGSAEYSVPPGASPQADASVRQLPVLPGVLVMRETTRVMGGYDRQAGETRGYHGGALERLKARGVDPRRG
ncbi:hypothetical protein LTR08_004185 [Meristemomyces frigidus]|nr:hypothetical protein LTR08_004185 [Meristemomyces frigidus]